MAERFGPYCNKVYNSFWTVTTKRSVARADFQEDCFDFGESNKNVFFYKYDFSLMFFFNN